jgi:hypothetical protein
MIDLFDPSRHFVRSRLTWKPRSHALTICQPKTRKRGEETYRHISIDDIERHLLLRSKYNLLRTRRFQLRKDIDHMLLVSFIPFHMVNDGVK